MATRTSAQRDKSFNDVIAISSSQNADHEHIQTLFTQHKHKAKQRRREALDNLAAKHEARIEVLGDERDLAAKAYKKTVDALTKPKLQRLIQLMSKRMALENQAEECEGQIEKAYLSAAQKLFNAIERRRSEAAEEG